MSNPVCILCDEPVLPSDAQEVYANGVTVHAECISRQFLGSVAHIQRRCSCFIPLSKENDPEGMTKRQAARAAVNEYTVVQRADHLNVNGRCPLCDGDEFHPGPRGGMATNIMCAKCGTKFFYCPPFDPGIVYNEDVVYDRRVRLKLERKVSDKV